MAEMKKKTKKKRRVNESLCSFKKKKEKREKKIVNQSHYLLPFILMYIRNDEAQSASFLREYLYETYLRSLGQLNQKSLGLNYHKLHFKSPLKSLKIKNKRAENILGLKCKNQKNLSTVEPVPVVALNQCETFPASGSFFKCFQD